jgi:tetratricopeptide (TPR) repeat protein
MLAAARASVAILLWITDAKAIAAAPTHEAGPPQTLNQVQFYKLNDVAGAGSIHSLLDIKYQNLTVENVQLAAEWPTVFNFEATLREDRSGPEKALERARAEFGPDHPEYANALFSIASAYLKSRDVSLTKSAEPYLVRALEIRRATLPANHIDIARTISALAQMYRASPEATPEKIQDLLQQAIEIRENSFRDADDEYEKDLYTLADILALRERYGEAEPILRRLLRLREGKLRSASSGTLNDTKPVHDALYRLGETLLQLHRYEEADSLLDQALMLRLRIDPSAAKEDFVHLGLLNAKLLRVEQANTYLEKAEQSPGSPPQGAAGAEPTMVVRPPVPFAEEFRGDLDKLRIDVAILYLQSGRQSGAMQLLRDTIASQTAQLGLSLPARTVVSMEGAVSNLWEITKQVHDRGFVG